MGDAALLHHDPAELVRAVGKERPQRAGSHRRAVAGVRRWSRGFGPWDAGGDAQCGAPAAWAGANIPAFPEQPRDPAGERTGLPGSFGVDDTRQELPGELRIVAVLAEAMARPPAIGRASGPNPTGPVRGRFRGRRPFYDEAKRVAQRQAEERAGDGIGVGRHSNKISDRPG